MVVQGPLNFLSVSSNTICWGPLCNYAEGTRVSQKLLYVCSAVTWCQLQLLLSLPLIVCCLWVFLKYQVERLIDTLLIFRKVYLPEEWDTSGVSTLYNTDSFTVQKNSLHGGSCMHVLSSSIPSLEQ